MADLWDIFTARHEYNPPSVDQYNRVSSKAAPFDVLKPAVSEYLVKKGFKPVYPGGKEFAVCISHDVDWMFNRPYSLNYFFRKSIISSLKGDFKQIKENAAHLKKHIPEYFDLNTTLRFDKKYNFSSSFYFLSLGPGDEDYRYNVAEIGEQFEAVNNCKGEIGLHGGHLAYANHEKLSKEKERLEKACDKKIHGYRNHYLRFDIKKTWQLLEENNFLYDTTFGYADSVGFRNGMCHPFIPYDLLNGKYYNLKEIPLMVMDQTLYKYLSLDNTNSLKLIKSLTETIKRNNGVLSLLWHNDSILGEKGKLYEEILELLSRENCWFATGKELIEWYDKNEYFSEITAILQTLKPDA